MFPATCPSWTIVFLIKESSARRYAWACRGLAVARREERHLRRFGLTLVLVEGIEVALGDVTENMSHGA